VGAAVLLRTTAAGVGELKQKAGRLEWLDGWGRLYERHPGGRKSLIAHLEGFDRGETAFKGLEVTRERETPARCCWQPHAYLVCCVVGRIDAGRPLASCRPRHRRATCYTKVSHVHVRKERGAVLKRVGSCQFSGQSDHAND